MGNATATDGCKYHMQRAAEIVNASRAALGVLTNESVTRPPTQAELAAKAAQEKFMKDFAALQEKRSAKLRQVAQQKQLKANEQKFKRNRAIKNWHKRKFEQDEKKKKVRYQQYLAADRVQNKLFEAVENETDSAAAKEMYEAQLGVKRMQIEQREEENLENERREASKELDKANDTIAKEIMVRKAVKISEEEKKAISKAKYEAEMAKSRAGASLLSAERDETMKELVESSKDDEKNLEELAAKDDGGEKDSNPRNTRSKIASGITGSTGATGATGVASSKKQKLLNEIKSGDLVDAIANAKNPELRIALEAKQREQDEERKTNNGELITDPDDRKKKSETRYPRTDVQLNGADGAHNGLGRPSIEDLDKVPTTEDYAEKMSGDGSIVNFGAF